MNRLDPAVPLQPAVAAWTFADLGVLVAAAATLVAALAVVSPAAAKPVAEPVAEWLVAAERLVVN